MLSSQFNSGWWHHLNYYASWMRFFMPLSTMLYDTMILTEQERIMSKITLVILAAGLGSRFGGLKQIEPVGSNNESIIDFSIYDAIEAGFNKVVLIIRPEHEEAFEKVLVSKIRPFIEVKYAYQNLEDIPYEITIDKERNKPWGTTHATLITKDVVNEPFIVINADDYYGKESFVSMVKFLKEEVDETHYSMAGYRLKNTTTEHGSVTRAVCKSEDAYLKEIVEVQKITKKDSKHYYQDQDENWKEIDGEELVSMNFWGFHPHVFALFEDVFIEFLKNDVENNPLKAEHVVPTAIGKLLQDNKIKVKILPSSDQWYGITYKEDREKVVEALKQMKENGKYPFDLWKK